MAKTFVHRTETNPVGSCIETHQGTKKHSIPLRQTLKPQ